MGIHVNIGEAKTRLSELVAAAERGEDVVIARAGEAKVRLQPIQVVDPEAALRAERQAWIGCLEGKLSQEALDYLAEPMFTDEELDGFGL